MTPMEMITNEMGKILNEYAEKKGVYDASLTIEQENKWLELVQDMANLIEDVTEENKKKVDVIELPMPYVCSTVTLSSGQSPCLRQLGHWLQVSLR